MTDVEGSDWSPTDASNVSAAPAGAPNNFARTDTKNIFRAIMGAVRRLRDRTQPTVTSAGTAPAFTLTYTGAPAAYVQGMTFAFKTHDTTTGSMTLNVNAVGAKKVYDITGTTQLAAGAFVSGTRMVCSYDTALDTAAGGFIWLNQGGSQLATQTQVNAGTSANTSVSPATLVARPGMVLQAVKTQTGAVATGSTAIPYDDTIPQSSEGDQYMSLSITPKSTTSILVITVTIMLQSGSGAGRAIAALFQDATANAIAGAIQTPLGGTIALLTFTHTMAAGTTSSTTFKVRGGFQSGTTTFNGDGSARELGGVLASSIVIWEYAA